MQHLWLIPAFPLAGFLVNGIAGRRLSKPLVNAFAVGSVLLSFLWVLKVLAGLQPRPQPRLTATALDTVRVPGTDHLGLRAVIAGVDG